MDIVHRQQAKGKKMKKMQNVRKKIEKNMQNRVHIILAKNEIFTDEWAYGPNYAYG